MLDIQNLNIDFGDFKINNFSFKVKQGEYYMLLGESGAGKSVILECLAGIVQPQTGDIKLNGKSIKHLSIQKRKVGLVFQDFALFPNLNVNENIAFPLKMAKTPTNQIKKEVKRLAKLMGITNFLNRDINTLSGGEKQRVALARTLSLKPDVLLLDEPLSAIDISLKGELRSLLRKLNKQGQTIVHVTHDYEEAISLAQKVGIMHCGTIIQEGTPQVVFRNPKNKFVANFGGIKNFFPVTIIFFNKQDRSIAKINEQVSIKLLTKINKRKGHILINQKNIDISRECNQNLNRNNLKGTIQEIIPARFGFELVIDAGIIFYLAITTQEQNQANYFVNEEVCISFSASAVRFIPG